MKVVRQTPIHEPLARAIEKQDKAWYSGYDTDDFATVTQLIKPPGMVRLEREHWDEIEIDAVNRIWMLLGSAVHKVIELAGENEEYFTEERFSAQLDGHKIGGGVDLIYPIPPSYVGRWAYKQLYCIADYKLTSVWAWIYGDRQAEWEAQLNAYAWLARPDESVSPPGPGFRIARLENVLIFRDWRRGESLCHDGYPPHQTLVHNPRLWQAERTEQYLRNRLQMLEATLALPSLAPDDMCTASERWEKPRSYAVMKDGVKRAVRRCETVEEARAVINRQANPDQYHIGYRPGGRVRCEAKEQYCYVQQWCPQYQAYLKEKEGERNGN